MPLEHSTIGRPPHLGSWIRSLPRHVMVIGGLILVLLLALRMMLPFILRHAVNARLQRIPGYTGQVADVRLHIWRGAYSMQGVEILRQEGRVSKPLFRAQDIDFSIAWREVLRGKIVSEITIERGELNLVKGSTEENSQTDLDRRWQEAIQDIFPIDITHLEITNGLLRYVDETTEPKVDVFIRDMHATAKGLRNRMGEDRGKEGKQFPADIRIKGISLGGGRLEMVLAAEPLAAEPHFHLSLVLEGVNLPDLNATLKAYANVDVRRGTFRLAAEMAGSDGTFQGYVKPFFEDLDFQNIEDETKGLGTRIWEQIIAGLAWIVKNKSRDQVATRIPFEGEFGDTKVGLLATIGNLFRHGFVKAFNPTVEGTLRAAGASTEGTSAQGSEPKESRKNSPAEKSKPDRLRAPVH